MRRAKIPWARIIAILAVLAGAAALWRWTALSSLTEPERLASLATSLSGSPFAGLIVTAVYVAASIVMFPVTGLILATAIAFDPWEAILYSLVGSVVSGLAGFAVGHVLAGDVVRRLAGSRLNHISKLLGRGGVVSVIALRVLPVAPFTVGNVVAGATHIRWLDFTIGTALGLMPGILAINLFETQATKAIRDPGVDTLLLLGGTLLAIVLGAAWARRTFKRLTEDSD